MKTAHRRWAPIAVVATIAFFVGLHIWGTHSEGYHFWDQTIRKSPAIQHRVGDVQKVQIGLLGGHREKFIGSNKWAQMTLNVVGSNGTVTVKAAANKDNGSWTVSDASIDGERVNLN